MKFKERILTLVLVILSLVTYVVESEPRYEYISSSSIPELSYMNTSVDPCDNFYQYTCGNFKNIHPLPDGKYNWDHFTILQEEVHQLAKVILESPRKHADPKSLQKAKAAYVSCVDTNYADQLVLPEIKIMQDYGIWPLLSTESIGDIDVNWNMVGDLVAEYGVPLFFNFQILSNYFDSSDNFIYLYRDALSNPATIYGKLERNLEDFLENPLRTERSTTKSEPIPFEAFLRAVAFHLRDILGTWRTDDEIIADLTEVITFMRVLQPGGFIEDDAEILPLDNLVTIEELQEWTDNQFGAHNTMNWLDYFNHLFKASGVTVQSSMKVYHAGASLLYGVLNLFNQAEARLMKNFIMVRLFTYTAPDSDEAMREAFDTYYSNQGYDVYPRWEYCLRKVLGYPSNSIEYSMALTYEYQKYHFNVNKLEKAADMVADLQDAFADILVEADWIDDVTKENALKKAQYMITLLGYPEFVEQSETVDEYYDGLRVCTWEHFWNSQRARSYTQALNFEQIGLPRNRELWNLSPLEVNAYYNRANNRILFPASIMNSVFFTGNTSALDYGRIGAIIGHEITHGFDSNGKNYNEEGVMIDWWTSETTSLFAEKTACFLQQYAEYYIDEIDVYVDASKTLNENLADNGGIRAAYRAFQKLKQRSSTVKTIEEYTPEQLFFIGFGTMWCIVETDYYLTQMHKSNSYPPSRYRVMGALSNMEEFAEAFNCPVGSNMNPENKCILW